MCYHLIVISVHDEIHATQFAIFHNQQLVLNNNQLARGRASPLALYLEADVTYDAVESRNTCEFLSKVGRTLNHSN